ncbi:hypothetical protein [Paraburkholderia rhizosphaerae]|uniref:Tetratricopeptide repeat protein n=1 Tax=Paraburkholderia rhizosphaerae TaxID=480658 RepID=A0A4R8LBH7_9BURK|nr:hypothetical protein [Paraburkholderia rhizosphaerae]TDY40251.1 hypothetical protein BX592_1264 [Paraburkholderia rhizosphaerae]
MNSVEKNLGQLRDLWMRHTQNEHIRVMVLRIADNADRMLDAFFALQSESGEWDTSDLFIRFDQPFDTGFSYSRVLGDALIEQYRQSFDDEDTEGNWPFNRVARYDSAAGFLLLLGAFARHHREQFRYVAAVLQPHPISASGAWETWLEAALQAPIPESIRLVIVDTQSDRRWQALADRFPDEVQVIEISMDMFDIMRETAMHAGGAAGSVGAYRQIMADLMVLLTRGSAHEVQERAGKAMQIARREQWLDQEAVLRLMIAGAQIKDADFDNAVVSYRDARDWAIRAKEKELPGAQNLVVQTWFGEGGACLAAGKMKDAARAYRSGAEQARCVPDPMLVVEGFRMAGFCFANARLPDAAKEHYVLAIRESVSIPVAQRAATTLPIVIQDLLRHYDARRVKELEACAGDYETDTAKILDMADKKALCLGAFPSARQVEAIEVAMDLQLEERYIACHKKRERLIAGGDERFREVVGTARELLHPRWNGLPEIRHPLDKTEAEIARLLENDDLDQTGAHG